MPCGGLFPAPLQQRHFSSRPTSGIKPRVTATSKRLCASLVPHTWYTASGWATPLRVGVPSV